MRRGPGRPHGMQSKGKGWIEHQVSALRGAAVLGLAVAVPATASTQQAAAQAAPAAPLVFSGVTVVDVEHGKLLPDQRVVIVGNRIQAVGSVGAVQTPRGARVVDARGKYLIPGLWDMHSHRGVDDGVNTSGVDYLLPLANGVTGIRDAYSAYVSLDSQVQWRREILAGTRAGPPRQLLAGTPINGLTDEQIADLKARGADFLKLYPFEPAVAAAARRSGLQYGGHVHGGTAIEASDSGMTILDHINTAGDLDRLCLGPEASAEQCQPVADRLRQNNTWFAPTMITFLSIGNNQWEQGMTPTSHTIEARLRELSSRFWTDSISHGNWLRTPDSRADLTGYLRVLRHVGIPIVAATDADGTKEQLLSKLKGFALHAELALYVAEGMTPLSALQSATLNPAKMLHGTDSLGTVAAGKLADLVLLDADPLADITNTTTIRAVVADGRYFDRAALDRLLADARKAGQIRIEGE